MRRKACYWLCFVLQLGQYYTCFVNEFLRNDCLCLFLNNLCRLNDSSLLNLCRVLVHCNLTCWLKHLSDIDWFCRLFGLSLFCRRHLQHWLHHDTLILCWQRVGYSRLGSNNYWCSWGGLIWLGLLTLLLLWWRKFAALLAQLKGLLLL